MKSYSLLIVICILFASFSHSQNSLQWTNQYVYSSREIQSDFLRRLDFAGPIKSMEYHYRQSYGDSLSEKFVFSENGILLTYTKCNSKGHVLCEATFSGDICTYYKEDFYDGNDVRIIKKNLSGQNIEVQESNTITTYLYDSLGRLLERKMNHGNGLRIDKTTLTYLPDNKLEIKEYNNNILSYEEHYIDTNLVKSISYSYFKNRTLINKSEFNQFGKPILFYKYDLEDGQEKFISKTTFVYQDGKLIEETYTNKVLDLNEGEILQTVETVFTLNETGLLITMYGPNEDGDNSRITRYVFDSSKNLVIDTTGFEFHHEGIDYVNLATLIPKNRIYSQLFDYEDTMDDDENSTSNDNEMENPNWKVVNNESGQPISNIHYWNGQVQDKETFEYHMNGKMKLQKKENFNTDGSISSYSYKELNEQGQLIKFERMSADGNMQRYVRPEPVLDSQGNWIINYFGNYPSDENQYRVDRDILYY